MTLPPDAPARKPADLNGWAVVLGRDLIERHNNADDFGALVAFAAVDAWRERGPAWETEGRRVGAQKPPGGWPALAGVTSKTWKAWRDRAIAVGLIERLTGQYRPGRRVDLLAPTVPCRAEGEQFAHVPATLLFAPGVGRTAKRVYLALALFRDRGGRSRAAVGMVAKIADLHRRNAIHGLRELEASGAIVGPLDAAKVRQYRLVEKWEPAPPMESQNGSERHPRREPAPPMVGVSATLNREPAPPYQENQESLQEGPSGGGARVRAPDLDPRHRAALERELAELRRKYEASDRPSAKRDYWARAREIKAVLGACYPALRVVEAEGGVG